MHKKGFFFSFEIMLNIHIDILSLKKKITNNNKAMGFKLRVVLCLCDTDDGDKVQKSHQIKVQLLMRKK